MPIIPVSEGQTLLDIALQGSGDLFQVFVIAASNGIDITDDLPVGSLVDVPAPAVDKVYLVDLFTPAYAKPVSADNNVTLIQGRDGIGFWAIEDDFIVQQNSSE
jgi:hypothetical protein